jgi:hypothetical protein
VQKIDALKEYIFTGIFMLCFVCSYGQREWPSDLWHDGKLVLLDGDTLKGNIKYDLQQDLVQYVVRNRTAEVYSARKVLFFEIFDQTVRKYRRFFSLPYSNPTGYKTTTFFELLEEGQITLLSREMLEYKSNYSSYYGLSYSRLELAYTYYLLKPDGNIQEFKANRNDLFALMGNKGKTVEKYMKANRLDHDDKYDLAQIVAYYNSLVGT